MRQFRLSAIEPERPTILLLNGGGQQPYNKFHKVTRHFQEYDCNLLALELPGHGKSAFQRPMSATEMLDDFYNELAEICDTLTSVSLFGYSLGGLLSLKALEQRVYPFDFVIATGAGLHIEQEQEDVMQYYASVEFFKKMRWHDHMQKYHEEGWQTLLDSMNSMLRVGSELFVHPDFTAPSPLYLILGRQDKVIDYRQQESYVQQPLIDLTILDHTNHFDYFTRSWGRMRERLGQIGDEYLPVKYCGE